MDRTETIKIISYIKAAYPAALSRMPDSEVDLMIAVWHDALAGDPLGRVLAAVKRSMLKSEQFPPTLPAVLNQLHVTGISPDLTRELAGIYLTMRDDGREEGGVG